MVAVSKHIFDANVKDRTCAEIFHTWHPNCFKANYIFVSGVSKGIILYLGAMYVAHYLLQRKMLTVEETKRILRDFVQSVIFGHVITVCGLTTICLQTSLLGKLNYHLTTFGLGTVMGATGFLSPKSRFPLEVTCFSIMALESLIKNLASLRVLPKSRSAAAPLFMMSNALMMLLLWKKQNDNSSINIKWIFSPFSNKEFSDNKICSHPGPCEQDFYKVTSRYVLIGGAISFIKLLINCFKFKEINIFKLMNKSYLKYPLFLGSYVGIYKAVHCILNQKRGNDSQKNTLIAGFLAGISFLINPNLSLVTTLIVLITKAVFKEIKRKHQIPKLPYEYLMFILSVTTLTHFWITDPKMVPLSMMNMARILARGRLDSSLKKINLIFFPND